MIARSVTDGPAGLRRANPTPRLSRILVMNKLLAALLASFFVMSGAFAAAHTGAPMAAPSAAGASAPMAADHSKTKKAKKAKKTAKAKKASTEEKKS
jgi:hypothetical protein